LGTPSDLRLATLATGRAPWSRRRTPGL